MQNPNQIMSAFHDFYADLSKVTPSLQTLTDFLDEIPLPTLTQEHITLLDNPITEMEVLGVIKKP